MWFSYLKNVKTLENCLFQNFQQKLLPLFWWSLRDFERKKFEKRNSRNFKKKFYYLETRERSSKQNEKNFWNLISLRTLKKINSLESWKNNWVFMDSIVFTDISIPKYILDNLKSWKNLKSENICCFIEFSFLLMNFKSWIQLKRKNFPLPENHQSLLLDFNPFHYQIKKFCQYSFETFQQ